MGYALHAGLLQDGWFAEQPALNSAQLPHTSNPLVARAMAGDVNAFNQLVLTMQRVAYHMAYRLLQSEEAAADAVQESLIKAFRALPTFRGGSFKSWFLRIVMNSCYDVLRTQKRQAVINFADLPEETETNTLLADFSEHPEAYIERMELRQWLERGINTLPVDQRIVIALHDIEGYPYDDIVEITGVPIGTVKSRLNRGRIRLRDFLLRHQVLAI